MPTNNFVPPDLPIKECLDEISQALALGHVTLSASTGSGKTTVVPLSLLNQPWLANKKILMLEPRRPAARMAAHRMAFLLGEKVGGTVGYQVRFDRQISQSTRIEVLTEGLLLRRLQSDPELSDVGLIIFDEFHERSLVADLSLALCVEVGQVLREDLRLLVMSASLDTASLTQLLNAKEITSDGRLHPVTVHYAKHDLPLNEVVKACSPLVDQALDTVKGDVLVFLPGHREITRLQALAEKRWKDRCEVSTLYGDLSAEMQDRVINPAKRKQRRLILTTDIAETSLTIEGVEAVVDGGRVRKPVFQPNNGLTRLETQWISKASALQRAGRAGRLGPGHCFRVWTESRQTRLIDWIPAEIMHADLASTVLELAVWGVSDPEELVWLDIPPKAHWRQATDLLHRLQAIDVKGRVTSLGREMAALPIHPRLGHMLLKADGKDEKQLVADIAALLSDRDPLLRRPDNTLSVDLTLRLSALIEWRQRNSTQGADLNRLKQLDRLSKQFLKILANKKSIISDRKLSVGGYLAMAFPDRVAKRRSEGGGYLMRSGRGVVVPQYDSLITSEYLVIADLDAGHREGRAWLAASIDLSEIEILFSEQIESQRITLWDNNHQKVVARERECLGEIVLMERQLPLEQDDPVIEVVLDQVKNKGLSLSFKQEKLDSLRARVQTIRKFDIEGGWPDVSEAGLTEALEEWLLPFLDKVTSLKQLRKVDLFSAFQSWLGWDKQQKLNKLLPEVFLTPAGTHRKIEYDLNDPPVLRAPLQEMLGVSESPTVGGGQLNLVVHLLSPAGRSLQVTQDLATFWKGSYKEVKKEMRGRYPKHYWPDDPANAEATRLTKRHLKK